MPIIGTVSNMIHHGHTTALFDLTYIEVQARYLVFWSLFIRTLYLNMERVVPSANGREYLGIEWVSETLGIRLNRFCLGPSKRCVKALIKRVWPNDFLNV